MTATLDNLHTAIKAKLTSLSGSGQVLSQVYGYHESAPAGFPAASVAMSKSSADVFNTTDNLRAFTFDIVIYQEFSTITRDVADGILRRTVDALIAAFDHDYTLGGACDYTLPIPMDSGFYDGPNGSIDWAMLTLVCYSEIIV